MNSIKHFDSEIVVKPGHLITVEENSILSGLGSAVILKFLNIITELIVKEYTKMP